MCTTSPGCTMMCLPVAIRCSSSCWVSSFFTTSLRLPRTVPSNETMPSMRDISAASFGRRASNSSATRGRPPVMSLVFGRLARRLGEQGAGGDDVALVDGDLRADGNRIGRERLVLRVADFDLRIEIFLVLDDDGGDAARRFVEFALHGDTGDHVLEVQRAALFGEHRECCRDPTARGRRPCRSSRRRRRGGRSRPRCCRTSSSFSSASRIWMVPVLLSTMLAPSAVSTRRRPRYFTMPLARTRISGVLKPPVATPPMWNVRMVSCVPGSPMDWAAMMPTESPIFATLLVAGLMP